MSRQQTRPIAIGDIYEISTKGGSAYVQVTHMDSNLGWVVWVLPGLVEGRPPDLARRFERDDGFFSFAPIEALLREGSACLVDVAPVPAPRIAFPLFRDYLSTDVQGHAGDHRLWDGNRTWSIGDRLTVDQSKLPLRRVPSPALFVERLEEGWRPELHEERVVAGRQIAASQKGTAHRTPVRVRHYLYFRSEALAHKATERIDGMGGSTQVRASAAPGEWLVLARAPPIWSRDRADSEFMQIASELEGRYDGAETEIG
jgi:hypothetical protein